MKETTVRVVFILRLRSWDGTMGIGPTFQRFVNSGPPYLARASLWLLPVDGRVHFLLHSWSNKCYLGFQSAVLVAIRAVTAEVASSSLVVPAIFQKSADRVVLWFITG